MNELQNYSGGIVGNVKTVVSRRTLWTVLAVKDKTPTDYIGSRGVEQFGMYREREPAGVK